MQRPDILQVGVKTPFVDVVSMTHVIADQRLFAAYIAFSGHLKLSLYRICRAGARIKSLVYVYGWRKTNLIYYRIILAV